MTRSLWVWPAALFNGALLVILTAASLGCSGGRDFNGAPGPTDALDLPAPSQLARYASYTPEDRVKQGSAYSGVFPSNRVMPQWINASYDPNWVQQASPTTADLAYAAYGFHLDGYHDEPQLHVGWIDAPANGNWWIGLARWDDDVWEWHQGTMANLVEFSTMEPYISGSDNVLLLVMVAGTEPCSLGYLRFGDRVGKWHVETVDATGDIYRFNSLALDSQGLPHIAYYESSSEGLKYAYNNSVLWDIEDVPGTADDGVHCSLALDSTGLPRISYANTDSGYLEYYSYDGGTWQTSHADISGSVVGGTSLVLDEVGQPHIAYRTYSPSELRYTYFAGGLWHPETIVDEGSPGVSASLALQEGHPRIAYVNEADKTGYYAWYNGSEWNVEPVDTNGFATGSALAFDAAGHPHISLFSTEMPTSLKHIYNNDTEWVTEELQQVQFASGRTGIAVDDQGWIHISYNARVDDQHALRHAWYDGEIWQAEVIETCTELLNNDTSLKLDPLGRPCISYVWFESGSSDGILKCAIQVD